MIRVQIEYNDAIFSLNEAQFMAWYLGRNLTNGLSSTKDAKVNVYFNNYRVEMTMYDCYNMISEANYEMAHRKLYRALNNRPKID